MDYAITDREVEENHLRYLERMELYRSHGYDVRASRERLAARLKNIPDQARILDVGCGKGNLCIAIALSGRTCVTVDKSQEEMRFGYLNAAYYKVLDKIDFQVQDAGRLLFEDNYFDAVLSSDLMHHIEKIELVLSEMLRVCKQNGIVIVADINKRGRQVMDAAHRSEGREHEAHALTMERVRDWFLTQKCTVTCEEDGLQTVVTVRKW